MIFCIYIRQGTNKGFDQILTSTSDSIHQSGPAPIILQVSIHTALINSKASSFPFSVAAIKIFVLQESTPCVWNFAPCLISRCDIDGCLSGSISQHGKSWLYIQYRTRGWCLLPCGSPDRSHVQTMCSLFRLAGNIQGGLI